MSQEETVKINLVSFTERVQWFLTERSEGRVRGKYSLYRGVRTVKTIKMRVRNTGRNKDKEFSFS